MESQLVTAIPDARTRSPWRTRVLSSLGPLTIVGGIVWAIFQPWRITLLHPSGQGFWWLVVEPPLLVVLVGLVFGLLIVPGVLEDLEAAEEEGGR
jgi:hypothetical protein